MILLGLDLETTTFELDKLKITEIGAVLYDTRFNGPTDIYSVIVDEPDRPPIEPFVEGLTGISDDLINSYGVEPQTSIIKIHSLFCRADFIVAHNGDAFDKPALKLFFERYGYELPNKPWIDTMKDIPYNEYITTRKLEDLCGRHGFLNPFPHRAFADVMSMFKILSQYDLDEVIKINKSPEVTFQALFNWGCENFNEIKDKVKAAGFKWNPDTKQWILKIKSYFIDREKYINNSLWDFKYKELIEL